MICNKCYGKTVRPLLVIREGQFCWFRIFYTGVTCGVEM